MNTNLPSFGRYIVNKPITYWWEKQAEPFLIRRGWHVIKPCDFKYETSYGFDAGMDRCVPGSQICDVDYCLQNAAAVIEYYGEPVFDSIFDHSNKLTIIDDLTAFISIYSGTYCQYLWKEKRSKAEKWSASLALQLYNEDNVGLWAASPEKTIDYFEKALSMQSSIDEIQFRLAMNWYFIALREFEIGRPLLEAALNWVCLEVQANYLGLRGNKFEKVQTLLKNQRFPPIPLLGNLYRLRNDGFHSGQLSQLSEIDAQAARTAGRALVRASILVLLGMNHTNFRSQFSSSYL
ncbi:MAG: hypothetical protein PHO26_06890 [Dehalococcoidia bacterium]|nr:hypothetical protein [Dehalococcoidia bacterium]